MHGILTEQTVELTDAVVVNHTYPHVDFPETGERAARLLLKILAGEADPVTARVPIPALVRGDELITTTGVFGKCMRIAKELEAGPRGLSAGMFIGNPFTDVPELQSYSFVVTNGDAALAEREALRMARTFWADHERMQVPLVTLEQMAEIVLANHSGTLALVDAADATSSGASGDSNAILAQLVKCGYQGRFLVAIADAPAAKAAFAAGVGAMISVTVGGTLDPVRYTPLPIKARVRMLSDGEFRHETFGEGRAGPTAVLEADNFTIIVTTRPANLRDRALFLAHGQDPRRFDAVDVKSPHCEKHMYADWCVRLINVDAPGATSANLRRLGHTRCVRPIFPLDASVPFEPQARVFKRARTNLLAQ
jgi:microcystin degradation protein MlrC